MLDDERENILYIIYLYGRHRTMPELPMAAIRAATYPCDLLDLLDKIPSRPLWVSTV